MRRREWKRFKFVTDNFITTPQRTQSGVSAVLPTVRQAQVSSLFIDLRPDLWILSITFIWMIFRKDLHNSWTQRSHFAGLFPAAEYQ